MLSSDDLDKLRKAGRVAAQALQIGMDMVAPGVKLIDVAAETESFILAHGARMAFPVNLSINEVAAHYTPAPKDRRVFEIGDVVKVDVGAHIDGFVGDTAGTVEAGTKNYTRMIEASRNARDAVTEFIGDGCPMNEIGKIVDAAIKRSGFVPISNLMGHQIKPYNLHSGLSVPNVDDNNRTPVEAGMVLAIEPFATNGAGKIRDAKQGNIYRVARNLPIADPDLKAFFEELCEKTTSFPFCERWFDHPKTSVYMNKLMRHGLITAYAQLVEVKGGCVTQSEHTVYVSGKKAEITTLP